MYISCELQSIPKTWLPKYVMYFFVLYTPTVSAVYDYMLWGTTSGYSGEISYTGSSVDYINGEVNSLYTGTMKVLYKSCTANSLVVTSYRDDVRRIFFPKKISINGNDIALSIATLPSGYTQYDYNNDYYMLKSDTGIYSSNSYRICSDNKVGNTYPINYTYPSFSFNMSVASLNSGSYSGTAEVKMSYAEHFASTQNEFNLISDDLAYQYSFLNSIPVNINVINRCLTSSDDILLSHGSLAINVAEGSSVTKTLNINCDEPASLTVSLISRDIPSPSTSYSDGIGVNLGNGWVSKVAIGDTGISDVSLTNKTISVPVGGVSLPIISELIKNGTVTGGNISGSLVINLAIN